MEEKYPRMDIRFPESSKLDVVAKMQSSARFPWGHKHSDAFERPAAEGFLYFHHEEYAGLPACTLCIGEESPGHLVVQAIVPDEGQINPIPLAMYKSLLLNFDIAIAEPAVEPVGGLTAVEYSKYRLEDYFSPDAVAMLRAFCSTANQSDGGSHPLDQERWMAFLIRAHDDGKCVHCDVFGRCLKNAGWWNEEGIADLVREYDFALRLLEQRERQV